MFENVLIILSPSFFFFFQFLVPNTFFEYRKKGGSKGEQEGFRSQLSHHCLIPKEIGKLQGKKKKKTGKCLTDSNQATAERVA